MAFGSGESEDIDLVESRENDIIFGVKGLPHTVATFASFGNQCSFEDLRCLSQYLRNVSALCRMT